MQHPFSLAVGRSGQKKVQKFLEKRKPTEIYGRKYSAHAIERMQERGFTPTIIEHSIEYGIPHPFPEAGKISLYESENKIEVIINSETKNVISVYHMSIEDAIKGGYNVEKKSK